MRTSTFPQGRFANSDISAPHRQSGKSVDPGASKVSNDVMIDPFGTAQSHISYPQPAQATTAKPHQP